MEFSKHLALGLALFSWFVFCQGCASDTPSDTYRTSYRISLADIPELVPLDSMRLEVRIDGVLDTSISVPQAALLDRNFSYTVESVSGVLIDIDYVVYSGTTALAQGHDHYDPRVAAPDTVALARDTAAIRVILDGISYSKALSIAFAGRSDTLTETTTGNLSAGAQTDSAMNVVVSALPTSAMSATDYSLVASVRIPAGAKVGTLVDVELALAVTHAAVGGKDTTTVIFRNDDYEYFHFLSTNPNNSDQALLGIFDGALQSVRNYPYNLDPGRNPLWLFATPAGRTLVFSADQKLHGWENSAWDAGVLYRATESNKTVRHVSVVPGDSVLWEFKQVVSTFTFTCPVRSSTLRAVPTPTIALAVL